MAKAKEEIKPGDVLGGKYRIERVIGQGGMGVVAAARHTELHQRVAIKVLPEHLATDKDLVERFMREARASARLRSEHAVKVVDVGRRKSGSPYIVMELLEGEDLGALVDRGPMPIPEAVDYILQASEAVAEAHALGIVHRDLKPRNLFLTAKLHGKAHVKVLDFGLAKRIDMQDRALTATAAVMGSPQYMSPEQMKASRNVDIRTDVWSLGVCLYELISARMPFDADSVPIICAMVLKDDPVPLPSVRPDVPLGLWNVIQRCLQKNPEARFATMSELAAALEPFAPAHSRGSAERIAAVLITVQSTQTSEPPQEFRPGGRDTETDTRTAATFDSDPLRTRASTTAWWVFGSVALALMLTIGGVMIVKSMQERTAARAATDPSATTSTATTTTTTTTAVAKGGRESAQYVPDLVGIAQPTIKEIKEDDPAGGATRTADGARTADAGKTSGPGVAPIWAGAGAGAGTPAIKIPRPPASAKPAASVRPDPAAKF